ncbi:Ig-like domain-containing protein [Klenkia sp. LSe6-5]|uniref:Ig-like domain-containing protein n=1 Tax=Klenkia sesuvii TaxID=3103137 RepID=A0ABU8DZC6_9ACTN
MRFTSPSRRALGVVAASTIGMSTAVLGVTGVASAAPIITSTSQLAANTEDGDTGLTVPAGYCTASVQIDGASGGRSGSTGGPLGKGILFTVALDGPTTFAFARGGAGGDDADGTENGTAGTNSGAASLNGTDGAPGGGGAAGSALLVGGAVVASAKGGDGAGTEGGVGGGATGVSTDLVLPYGAPQIDASGFAGGYVGVIARGCEAPDAPSLADLQPRDGGAVVFFNEPGEPDAFTADATGYQYRVGTGSWVSLTAEDLERGWFEVGGLTNGTEYSITMQSLSEANGPSEASDAGTVTPFAVAGAPAITAVKTGPSQITVSWAPSARQGTYPVAGYGVYWGQGIKSESDGQGGSGTGGTGCEVAASATSCTFFVPAGADYQVGVYSFDTEKNFSDASSKSGIVVPASTVPASVPTQDNGDVVGPAGPISKLTAGQKVTLQGTGYAPNSTVTLVVYSSPVTLGTVVADKDGNFSVEVTVPANLANGTHHLVATGVDRDGNVRNLVVTVTVSGGVATLATTGFDAAPVAVGGGLVLLTGAGLLVGARRRAS